MNRIISVEPSSPATLILLGLFSMAWGSAWAADPLDCVPATAASVIVFPNLEHSCKKASEYLSKHFPDARSPAPEDIESAFDLPCGSIDFARPVIFMGTQAGFDAESLVLGFTPRKGAAFQPKPVQQEGLVRTFQGVEAEHFFTTKRGLAFVSAQRRPLRALRTGSYRKTLSDALDPDQKKLLYDSDVFFRLSMDRWRERINPWMAILSRALNSGVPGNSQSTESTAESAAMLTWFSDGARSVVDQMRTLSGALRFDGQTIRLTHMHRFAAGESTATYLNQIRRNEIDFGKLVPDRRFIMMMTCDWESPAENTLSYRLCRMALELDGVAQRFEPQQRHKLLEASKDSYGQTLGSYFLMGTPRAKPHPIQILGGSVMRDAKRGMSQMRFVQENAADLLSVFMPGTGNTKVKFRERTCKGRDYLEMAFAAEKISDQFRKDMEFVYGQDPVFQMGVEAQNHLMYSICAKESSEGICAYIAKPGPGKTLKDNGRINTLINQMSGPPNIVCLVDVDAMFDALPIFLRAAMQKQGLSKTNTHVQLTSDRTATQGTGPIIGWSSRVQKDGLDGEFIVQADQIPQIVASARRAATEMSRMIAPSVRPPLPPKPPKKP